MSERNCTLVSLLDEARLREVVGELLDEKLAALAEQLVRGLSGSVADDPPHPEPMMTERMLAELLRCDPRTVRRLERSGELPAALRIGGSKRWRPEDVRSYLEGRAVSGQRCG